jgi:hypothetical protein
MQRFSNRTAVNWTHACLVNRPDFMARVGLFHLNPRYLTQELRNVHFKNKSKKNNLQVKNRWRERKTGLKREWVAKKYGVTYPVKKHKLLISS